MQNYREQEAAAEDRVRTQARNNQATQLRACQRHYREMLDRVEAPPINVSGDAILVRTDIYAFLIERIDACQHKIDELTR